jgi:transcriptional regulator GlxA family with amidase domain
MRQRRSPAARPRLSVGFILARRFTLCAFANFVDVLRLAADEGDRSRPILCRWAVLSDSMAPVLSSCGVAVQPHEHLGDPGRFDYIVVVGGLIDEIPNLGSEYGACLRRAAAAGVPLVGVCTGAFVLHRLGLMEGYRCCISWFHHADFLEYFDGLRPVSDQIFVVDRDRLTCSGGASSAHLAAWLVRRHIGERQALKSLRIMIIDEAEQAETPQPGMPIDLHANDPTVRRAILLMQENLSRPLPITVIAERLGIGRRRLERRFRRSLGLSPMQACRAMRLDHAQHLLDTSRRSVTAIAAEAGFADAAHFIRAFRARHGRTPGALRLAPE